MRLQSLLGIAAILGFAWLISENRRAVPWKHVGIGLAVSVVLAALFLKLPPLRALFASANSAVDAIGDASRAGTSFVFGYLGGGPLPFELKLPGAEFVLAFQALPIVLLMSVLTTLLFYWRILPPIVRGFSWALERTMGVGGAVGLSTAANIFVGHVEAPLFIRPYLAQLSRGELFVVMTGGMAGIAGTVLVLYTQFLASERARRRRPFHHRLGAERAARGADRPDHGAGRRATADRQRSPIPSRSPTAPWTRSPRAPPPGSRCCST